MSDNPSFGDPIDFGPAVQIQLGQDAIDRLASLGVEAAGVTIETIDFADAPLGLPKSVPVAVVHGDSPKLISVKNLLEEYRQGPERAAGTATALTLASFIALTNRFKGQNSAVFADTDWKKPNLLAVIDYNGAAETGFGRHRIAYRFPLSLDWQTWLALNDKPMSQEDFAIFIEERMGDLTAPDDVARAWFERDLGTTVAAPAELITLSRGLQVNVTSEVAQHVTLQSGAGNLRFKEEHTGANGAPIVVPGGFILNVAPFVDSERVEIPVRLRYRVKDGKVMWRFQIYRPDEIVTTAVRDALAKVKTETALPIFEGAPEMSASGAPVQG